MLFRTWNLVCDAVVVMNRGQMVMQARLRAQKPAGRIFEVRVKGDRMRFGAAPPRGRSMSETDADVLRVTLRQERKPNSFLIGRSAGARFGTSRRAYRRSKKSSPKLWGRVGAVSIASVIADAKTASIFAAARGW